MFSGDKIKGPEAKISRILLVFFRSLVRREG